MNGIKYSNDSVSPSPFFFTKEFMVHQYKVIIILKFFRARPLQTPLLTRQSKAHRPHLHHHYYHLAPDRAPQCCRRGDGWGREISNRRWCSFGIDGVLLTHLLFFIGVIEDDGIAIVGRPKKPAVEVIEELPGELLIS
jgi:hypothetical protein